METSAFSLEGKVAIVTGGKRGIGRAIALDFAEAGADVAICSRGVEDGSLEAVAKKIEDLGRRSLAIKADVSKKIDVDNMVQKVTVQFGSIDILVNNAGITLNGPLLDFPEDDWDKVIDVDLKGYFLCAQAAGRRMVEQKKGTIINVSSIFAFQAFLGRGAYCVAKAGVVMLTRVLARELGGYGIRANAIAPGLVKTEFSRAAWTKPEVLEREEAAIPLGRISETEDLVGAALFLASDASAYVTGHTILLEGGRMV